MISWHEILTYQDIQQIKFLKELLNEKVIQLFCSESNGGDSKYSIDLVFEEIYMLTIFVGDEIKCEVLQKFLIKIFTVEEIIV